MCAYPERTGLSLQRAVHRNSLQCRKRPFAGRFNSLQLAVAYEDGLLIRGSEVRILPGASQNTLKIGISMLSPVWHISGSRHPEGFVDDVFVELLAAGAWDGHDLARLDSLGQIGQRRLASGNRPAELAIPASVSIGLHRLKPPLLHQPGGSDQRSSQRIDAANVRVKEILAVEGLASQFGIEVETTSSQSAAAKDFVERHNQVFGGVRKLVRVPPVLRIAAVGVDRPQ